MKSDIIFKEYRYNSNSNQRHFHWFDSENQVAPVNNQISCWSNNIVFDRLEKD